MHVKFNFPLLLFIILLSFFTLSNNTSLKAQSREEIIENAKELSNSGELKQALVILKDYHESYPDDLNGAWLYAQTAFWLQKNNIAFKAYETAIQYNPENYGLKLDYALALSSAGELNKALPILLECYEVDKENTVTLFALARVYFWSLDYRKAKQMLYELFLINPQDDNAVKLAREIFKAEALNLNVFLDVSSDDQPLTTPALSADASKYFGQYSIMYFKFSKPLFVTNDKTYSATWFKAGNVSFFNKQAFKLNFDAGLINLPDKAGNKLTWNIKAEKRLSRALSLSGQFERKPYFYTLSSLTKGVFYNNTDVSLDWRSTRGWSGKASVILTGFDDENRLSTYSAWLMSKPAGFGKTSMRLGYGFNYSNALENKFVAVKTLPQILNTQASGEQINGIYNPYFTPNKQNVHTLLALCNYKHSESFSAEVKISAGVLATSENPYFYLDYNSSNKLEIFKSYYERKFVPLELSFSSLYNVSDKMSFKASYIYNNSGFYKSHALSLGLLLFFINEEEK